MTRNQRYEQQMKAQGLEKVTLWIPKQHKDSIKEVARASCSAPELEPWLLRNMITGRSVSPSKVP